MSTTEIDFETSSDDDDDMVVASVRTWVCFRIAIRQRADAF